MRRAACLAIAVASAPAAAQTPDQLKYVCKDFVERSLHDPRDAQLNRWADGTVARRKDGLWVVTFPGRAMNPYGALRLATFECVIRHDGGDNFTSKGVRAR